MNDSSYGQLEKLLREKNWKEADIVTYNLMHDTLKIQGENSLDINDIETFPCTDLHNIDRLWVKYSEGHFGFSVQNEIWVSVGGKPDPGYKTGANCDTFIQFGERVGWSKEGDWLKYSDLTFDITAPKGHLPLFQGWGDNRIVQFEKWICLFSRVQTCGL